MNNDTKFLEDVYLLLLPAVRLGDVDLLKSYLSTVINPERYLNEIFDEENMQKCTLLAVACLNGHEDILELFVKQYKPNLEIKNNILFHNGEKTQQMCTQVSVLWIAAAVNNFSMVKLLVEYGAHVNHTTQTNSTPLRSACYNGNLDIIRYFISQGANVHIAKENNDTNLAVSVYCGHLNVARYLVNELGCDVNHCDNDGRSPLYDAVNGGSLELVEFLLERGARNFPAKIDQMSPLMWAAEKRRVDLMEMIASHCTIIEQIEAEELIGSAFICADLDRRDLEQGFKYLCLALELRRIHRLSKDLLSITNELFNNRQECQTIEELLNLQPNISQLYIEAFLIRERLLGPKNSEYRYSLRYYGAVLADMNFFNQAIDFWMYEQRLRQEYAIEIDSEHLRHFTSMFSEMISLDSPIPFDALLQVMKILVGELKRHTIDFDFNFHTLLFLITIISQFFNKMHVPSIECRGIYQYIYWINQQKYFTKIDQSSLLHLSLNSNTLANDYFIDGICKYPCSLTVHILIQCGADINAMDAVRNTPLHILVLNERTYEEKLLNLLCDNGAHLDYANAFRKTPIDLAYCLKTQQLLKSKLTLSLKCLCAQFIQKMRISYEKKLSKSLVKYIEEH